MSDFPNLNNVRLAPDFIPGKEPKLPKHILTATSHALLLRDFTHFDILTYTISSAWIFRSRPIHRLIYCVGTPPITTHKYIRVSGTHAKLWLCYKRTSPNPTAIISSANATEMTLHELSVVLDKNDSLTMLEYFNNIWTLNYKKK